VPCPSCGKQLEVPGTADLNLVGATFAGVEIDAVVAKGSRSIVYRGRASGTADPVAVKVLTGEGEGSAQDLERFEREARAASRLRHPNIVAVHRVGKEAGKPYIVMDYVMGRTLAIRTEAGPLPTRSAMAIIASLASAVQHAHEQGIVHRDLKPENVLFDESGSPRIMDFGLARDVSAPADSEDGTEGKIVGTPAYMPPEQAQPMTSKVDEQSDVYALGAILYEMLTGHPPFAAVTTALLVKKVREAEPPKPSALNPDVHPDAETICLRAMERTKTRRYATAQQLGRDAEAFLGGKRIEAVPPGVTEKAPRWVWRHRVGAATVAVGALVVAAFAWAVWGARAELHESQEGARKGRLSQLVSSADDSARKWRARLAAARARPGTHASDDAVDRAERDFAGALSCYLMALEAAPEGEKAFVRAKLAGLLDDGLRDAEAAGERGKAATVRELARAYCPARLDDILSATGTLRVDTVPRGATVRLARWAEQDGRLTAPALWRDLGTAPVLPLELEAGRLVLAVEAPGHVSSRAPVTLGRGENLRVDIRLPRSSTTPAGLVFVSVLKSRGCAGGGGGGGFLIGRTEVTMAQYLRFVQSLPTAKARLMAPAPPAGAAGPGPVTGVTAAQAEAYCRWLSKRTGRRFRLPTRGEWMHAAGRSDGRPYPWGWYFDERWLAGGSAADVRRGPADAGSHPEDESPYGVLDMGGNVAEWVAPDKALPGVDFQMGGSYLCLEAELFRIRPARTVPRGTRGPATGFRVVCEAGE